MNKLVFDKEDANPFLFEEKFRSTSNEDVDSFLFEEKFKSASNEDADPFLFEEKFIYASIMKMQTYFILKKKNCQRADF